MMLAPVGPTVLTMWTLGVEVERCLCRDWPSPPSVGKRKAEVGDRRSILCHQLNKSHFFIYLSIMLLIWLFLLYIRTYPAGSGVKAKLLCDGEFSGISSCGYSSVQALESHLNTAYVCELKHAKALGSVQTTTKKPQFVRRLILWTNTSTVWKVRLLKRNEQFRTSIHLTYSLVYHHHEQHWLCKC